MARKKRTIQPVAVPENEAKAKAEAAKYRDHFQQSFGGKVEEAGKKLEGHGKTIMYGLAALAVLAVVIWIFYVWSGRSNANAQTALGRAIETSQAQVSDTPPAAGTNQKTFKTEKERAEAAIAEFNAVAEKFGGDVGEKAKYFAAVNRLAIDRPAGIQELEPLSKSNDEVGKMAKFALAQAKTDEGKPDEAAALYQELLSMSDPLVAKETLNFLLAGIYEKQGKKQEAVELLFNLVKSASEAKDLEGKPVALTATAQSAKEKLQELDPEKAKEIPEQVPESPFGM